MNVKKINEKNQSNEINCNLCTNNVETQNLLCCSKSVCTNCYSSSVKNQECSLCKTPIRKYAFDEKDIITVGSGETKLYRGYIRPNEQEKIAVKKVNLNDREHNNIQSLFELTRLCGAFIQLIDHFTYENNLYLIMEYAENNLKNLLEKQKEPIQNNRIFEWSKDILTGIEFLHSNNIIHRDIKPENLLLFDNQQRIKLAGFSSMIPIEDNLTTFIGDPSYNSPEIEAYNIGNCLKSRSNYGFKTDNWSFGCVLFELICQSKLFPAISNSRSIQDLPKIFANMLNKSIVKREELRATSDELRKMLPENWDDSEELKYFSFYDLDNYDHYFLPKSDWIKKKDLCGLENYLEQLQNLTNTNKFVLLRGVIGSGKTTLLRNLNVPDTSYVYYFEGHNFEKEIENFVRFKLEKTNELNFYENMNKHFENLKSSSTKVIFVIDGVNKISNKLEYFLKNIPQKTCVVVATRSKDLFVDSGLEFKEMIMEDLNKETWTKILNIKLDNIIEPEEKMKYELVYDLLSKIQIRITPLKLIEIADRIKQTDLQTVLDDIKNYKNVFFLDDRENFSIYDVVEKLEIGKFADKFIVVNEDDKNNKKVLTRINNKLDKEDIKEVLKEAIVLTRIRCDNLLQNFSEYFIENKELFLVKKHYNDERLSNVVNNLNEEINKSVWMRDIIFALDYLHLHLQTHKQVYPNNIYVRNNRLILGEIGLSIELLKYKEENCEGSLYYGPEYLDKTDFKFERSFDIWSAGCVFYEILYSKKCFKSVDEIKQWKKPGKEDNALLNLIYEMLNPNQNERPKSRNILKALIEKLNKKDKEPPRETTKAESEVQNKTEIYDSNFTVSSISCSIDSGLGSSITSSISMSSSSMVSNPELKNQSIKDILEELQKNPDKPYKLEGEFSLHLVKIRKFAHSKEILLQSDHLIYEFLDLPTEYPVIKIKGYTLHEIMETEKKLEYNSVSSYFCQLLLAIEYLHSRIILHANVNPNSIYINNGELKLAGFHLSEKLDENCSSSNYLDKTKLFYHCPENEITLQYDMWCIGRVIYEMTSASGNINDASSIKPANDFRTFKKLLRNLIDENPRVRPSIKTIMRESHDKMNELNIPLSHIKQRIDLRKKYLNPNRNKFEVEQPYLSYTVKDLIGYGSFGTVFLVQDKDSIMKALKRVNKYLNQEKIEREIAIFEKTKELNCENIIKYYHSFDQDEYSNIITEYCENGDLKKYFMKLNLNKVEEIEGGIERQLDWSTQILCGLDFMHNMLADKKIVHRDIKPENILITNDYRTLKFADFGLSIQITGSNQMLKTNCGTFRYMAPEVERGQYTNKCDVWSAGCVLFEIVTLKHAFEGYDKNNLAVNIKNCNVSKHLSNKHILYDLILNKMIKLDPNTRFGAKQCYSYIQELNLESFQLIQTISLGEFENRFLAYNKQTKEEKLIRSFNQESDDDKERIKKVLKEVIVLTRIRCQNLAQDFSSYFIEKKHLYAVMTNYNNEPLSERFKQDCSSINYATKDQWCKDLAFALDYLHLHLQSHKKIYPKNIFIKNNRLVLGEIGLTSEVLEFTNRNDPEIVLYYPREFFTSDPDELKSIDFTFDVWCLGCVFFHIYNNERPFASVDSIIRNEFAKDTIDNRSIIKKMLCPDPKDRMKTRNVLKYLMDNKNVVFDNNRYELIKNISVNRFDSRFLVQDTHDKNKKKYILSRIKKSIDTEDLKDTLKECIVLSRIRSDNLIQDLVRYFIENKQLYYLIAYYEDNTLREYLDKNSAQMSVDQKYMFCIDLAFSLDYLHIHLQNHLKIYPANILVRKERLVLGEYGIKTRILKYYEEEEEKEYSLYYPPEYRPIRNDFEFKADDIKAIENSINMKFDIWSLGCVFYEIFTGEKPFSRRTELFDLSHLKPLINENFYEIILKMLSISKEERPPTRDFIKKLIDARSQMNRLKKTLEKTSYDINDVINTNGFETRYLATGKTNSNKQVILRRINPELERKDLESTLKEIIVLNRIKCNNLIQDYVNYFIESKQIFIVMNPIGYDHRLDSVLETNVTTDHLMKAIWFTDLAFAIDYLHKHLQCHKMICPRNIYVKQNRLFLGEIGLKLGLKMSDNLNMEAYNPPNDMYELKSDIWSLGCVFYEIVYLEKAFTSTKDPNKLEYRDYYDIFNSIIKKMLTVEPDNRINSRDLVKNLINLKQDIEKNSIKNDKYKYVLIKPEDTHTDINLTSSLVHGYSVLKQYKSENKERLLVELKDNLKRDKEAYEILKNIKSHEYLVDLHDYSLVDVDKFYIVVDAYKFNLDNYLKTIDDLKQHEVLLYTINMIEAVKYLHSNKIFHSFVNSKSIYIYKNTLKLGGFYYCERLEPEQISQKENRILSYDSPDDQFGFGFNYDTWCIGCVLYEMCYALAPTKVSENFEEFFSKNSLDSSELWNSKISNIEKSLRGDLRDFRGLLKSLIAYKPDDRLKLEDFTDETTLISPMTRYVLNNQTSLQESLNTVIRKFNEENTQNLEILNKINSGSYGLVFKVKEKTHGKIMAMKRIDFINKDEPVKNQILRQIIREINSLKTLSKSDDTGQYGKRNIISFYDYFSSQGHYYVLTEYCEDGNLRDYISSKFGYRNFRLNLTISYIYQLINGLQYIHSLNIVHRDIKPENILLTNKNKTIKYADFGFSIQNESARSLNKTTLGTLRYQAPELVRPETGEQSGYQSNIDVWSLGCVIYEICTFEHMFTAKDSRTLTSQITQEDFYPIPTLVEKNLAVLFGNYFEPVNDLIKTMIQRNFKNRPGILDEKITKIKSELIHNENIQREAIFTTNMNSEILQSI